MTKARRQDGFLDLILRMRHDMHSTGADRTFEIFFAGRYAIGGFVVHGAQDGAMHWSDWIGSDDAFLLVGWL